MSRPARARGLKLHEVGRRTQTIGSRPARARGLKHTLPSIVSNMYRSRPARARGLKLLRIFPVVRRDESRPARARGLKHRVRDRILQEAQVAPRAGAWIETYDKTDLIAKKGRAPRGRVD